MGNQDKIVLRRVQTHPIKIKIRSQQIDLITPIEDRKIITS